MPAATRLTVLTLKHVRLWSMDVPIWYPYNFSLKCCPKLSSGWLSQHNKIEKISLYIEFISLYLAVLLKFKSTYWHLYNIRFQIKELEGHLVLVGGGILLAGMVLRAMVTSVSAVRSNLNMREKIFVGFAWMAKATVQVRNIKNISFK